MTTNNPLESYIVRFRCVLAGMTLAEQEDIVAEIRAHIHERVSVSGMSIEETLARLGSPEDLAREYNRGVLVRRASNGFSPLLILRAAFAWAMTGVHGAGVFLTALFGYALAFGFMLWCLLKMVYPDEIGLWIDPDFTLLGFRSGDITHGHEVLGSWFQPITFGIGLLFFTLTTMLMRTLLHRFKQWRTSASSHSEAPRAVLQSVPGLARRAARSAARRLRAEFRKRPDTIRSASPAEPRPSGSGFRD
jgi:hypothetical protein